VALTKVTSAVIKDATITDADIGSTLTTAITGSFTSVSSSIATRFDSRESDMTLATASIAAITSSISRLDDTESNMTLATASIAAITSSISTINDNMTLATASIAAITASLGQPVNTDSDVTFGTVSSGDITSTGTITAVEVHTTFVSSSIAVISGSNNFGDATDDHHSFTGSLSISGSGTVTGSFTVEGPSTFSTVDINGGTVDAITSLTVANDVDVGNYKITSKALEASDLTATRVVFGGSNGLLADDSDLTFATATLSATNLTTTGTIKNMALVSGSATSTGSFGSVVAGGTGVNSFTGKVGIGTATPTETLHVEGSASFAGNYIVNEQGRQDHVANTMPAPYYRFDGANDYVNNTNVALFEPFTNDTAFSVEMLFRPVGSVSEPLFAYRVDASNYVHCFLISGTLYWRTSGTVTGFRHKMDTAQFTAGEVSHLIMHFSDTASTQPIIYINGVSISYTATAHSSDDAPQYAGLTIGRGIIASPVYMEGEVYKLRLFNYGVSATEVKELYSGASVPYKYKGANQTELILAAGASDDNTFASDTTFWTNSGGTTISGNCVMNANGQYISRLGLLTIGKRYRVNVDVVSGDIRVRQGAVYPVGNVGTGVNNMYFTATSTEFEIVANGAAATIDNIYIYQIGAVAEYDGSGIGKTRWDDKSGNDLHGTVSGATVENAPADADSGLTYEEGTWTVTVTGDSGNFVLSGTEETGAYTKIGDLVHAQGGIQIDSESSCSGNIKFSLPFTSGNFTDLSERSFGSVWLVNTGETNSGHMVAVVTSAQAFFNIGQVADNGTNTYLTNAHVDGAWFLGFQITYKV